MSHYVQIVTAIKDQKALVRALDRMGFGKHKVELHDTPQNLYGYQGDVRSQKAHIILRRNYVGHASNDIGFERVNGLYVAHISEYDQGCYGSDWQKRLFTYYGVEKAKLELEKQGTEYVEDMDTEGRPRIRISIS